jgi:hypothetical protein
MKMIIDRLLRDRPLEPKIYGRIMTAYEQALHTLCVKDQVLRR